MLSTAAQLEGVPLYVLPLLYETAIEREGLEGTFGEQRVLAHC